MLNGERRWASARRGGMTVLGKVAVPKPINLPSQRLENHGLDPKVEIVPKGTLSWGSRPSSSTSNAWGSSSLSPNANSSNNSPSHLSARPSSAEAGTRPSTAGSDKIHDSAPNVWSSNLRPSSASGELSSNQTSPLSLRPCSAEPRPGSSQLSRFADPSSDISVPGSGERLEVTSSKNDGFSLNTGDFPSLGSVKCSSGKNAGSQDPSFHDSGSTSGVPMTKEVSENYSVGDAALSTDAKHTSDGSWRRDNPLYGEDGLKVSMEKWDGDTPPYQNPGILPQHFNAWCGPPVNNPPGAIWYRGPPSGPPPYGEPIPPGGFPMEPFQYYHPQIPASALPNPQQVPPPGTGPRGPHPRNGDMYRPQMPDAYIRPGMPVRPGFFSRPVPYDGYFGHPMGYCRPNDRDLPSMGMAGGPPSIYGQFPSQNAHDAGNSHIRPPEHGSNSEPCISQESSHHRDPEPYRVLLKPHDNWNEKSEEQKQEETQRGSGSMEKVDSSRASSWENDWRKDRRKDGNRDLKVGAVDEDASQNFDSRASGSLVPNKVKSPENLGSARVDRDYAGAGHSKFVTPGGSQSVAPKDSTLIEKIEGLNAKARASDLRPDFMFVSDRPEQGSMLHIQGTKSSLSAAGAGHHAPYPANVQVAQVLSTEDAAISGPNTSRRYPYSGHGKAHHQWGKGRFNSEDDGFRNKPAVLDPLLPTPVETSYVQRPAHRSSQPRTKYEGGYVPVTSGPGDIQAEHAKMKVQRVKQKREEEEERSREQKAKAQMKLEELNRRMQVVEGSNSKTESSILNKPQDLVPVTSGPGDIQAEHAKMKAQHVKQKREEEGERSREQKAKAQMKLEELNRRMQVVEGSNSKTESSILNKPQDLVPPVESKKIYGRSALSNSTPVSDGELLQQTMKNRNNTVGRSSNQTKEFQQEPPNDACKESVIIHNQSVPVQQHAEIAGDNSDVAPQIHSNVPSKQHWTWSKPKQSMAFEENTTQKIASEAPKLEANVADDVTTAVDAGADFSAHQRRRSNRGNRYKHKGDESSAANNLQSLAHKESGQVSVASVEGVKLKAETEQSVVGAVTKPTDVNHLLEQCPGSTHEEAHGWGSNQWKPQYSRRAPRNQQVNRVADKVHGGENAVWTPVRTHNTTEIADENNERTAVKDQSLSVKSDQPLQDNNPRGKRAEIERYVPKPVAKEMAQQGSVQLVAALDSQNKMADEAIQQVDTGSSSVAEKESRNADSRQNRSARGHGLWQQRCTTDNISVQGLHVEQSQSHFSQTSGNIRKQPEHNRRPKPEEQPSMEQIKDHDRGLSCGSVIFPRDSSILECQPQFTALAGRYQGTPGRGKRHPSYKAPKYDLDADQKKSSDKLEISCNPSVAPEVSQTDPASAASVPRENHGFLERATLHWQPKSRAVSGQNNQGNRAADDDQNAAGSSGLVNEKAPKEHDVTRDRSDFVKDKMHEEAGQFDNSKRERRPRSSAARPRSPVQVALKSEELANRQQEAGSSLGPHKSGNQSVSLFMRADENRGVRNSSRQDTRQYNVPTHRERQRYNSSYRYQPVGPYNEDRSSHSEGVRDGSQSAGPRYQERAGQSGSRRGGGSFNERQVGNS